MPNRFDAMAARMDAATVRAMAKAVNINGESYDAVPADQLQELGVLQGEGISLVVFSVNYTPSRSDAVSWLGESYTVTRHRMFNGKPQIWIE
jgi:hypothetical protein